MCDEYLREGMNGPKSSTYLWSTRYSWGIKLALLGDAHFWSHLFYAPDMQIKGCLMSYRWATATGETYLFPCLSDATPVGSRHPLSSDTLCLFSAPCSQDHMSVGRLVWERKRARKHQRGRWRCSLPTPLALCNTSFRGCGSSLLLEPFPKCVSTSLQDWSLLCPLDLDSLTSHRISHPSSLNSVHCYVLPHGSRQWLPLILPNNRNRLKNMKWLHVVLVMTFNLLWQKFLPALDDVLVTYNHSQV